MNDPVTIGDATLYCGDCREILPTLGKVDAVVTDPPYGISFMNQKWDYQIPDVDIWRMVIDILKPGAHALIACGTRTQHRMAVNIEDAGFEIRDLIAWIYGSGFPKSLNISKAIDRQAGIDIESRGHIGYAHGEETKGAFRTNEERESPGANNHKGVTPEAQQWEGWGTALKPAMELWTLARKPLSENTVAGNVLKHGTGGINIGDCKIGVNKNVPASPKKVPPSIHTVSFPGGDMRDDGFNPYTGRFPTNVIHDGSDEVLAEFNKAGDRMSGGGRKGEGGKRNYKDNAKSGSLSGERSGGTIDGKIYTDEHRGEFGLTQIYGDSGSAARFFYCAKAALSERKTYNDHPTVKPVELMKYLVTLITPQEGIVIDPYMGSGSGGVACAKLGRKFIGIEIEPKYFDIACERIKREYDQLKMF